MSYITLEGCWCDTVKNVNIPTENKSDDTKDSFYDELEYVFDRFPKCHMNIFVEDFNEIAGKEVIFKPTIRNESLNEMISGNDVTVANFTTLKNLISKCAMFIQYNIQKYTWISDGKTHTHLFFV
jgi:hypothetical protein